MTQRFIEPDANVRSSTGDETGKANGNTHVCSLHGCSGLRVSVRWPDGKTTYPCSKGMTKERNGDWKIR